MVHLYTWSRLVHLLGVQCSSSCFSFSFIVWSIFWWWSMAGVERQYFCRFSKKKTGLMLYVASSAFAATHFAIRQLSKSVVRTSSSYLQASNGGYILTSWSFIDLNQVFVHWTLWKPDVHDLFASYHLFLYMPFWSPDQPCQLPTWRTTKIDVVASQVVDVGLGAAGWAGSSGRRTCWFLSMLSTDRRWWWRW